MNRNKGNSLSQYAIILALVALALVPLFLIFGQTIYSQFDHFYRTLATSSTNNANSNTKIPPSNNLNDNQQVGPLGGTPDNPVKECSGKECTLDFGEFVISGIPDNFNEFIQTAGTSGTTDKFVSIFDQIAQQLEDDGLLKEADDFRTLANLGHFLASSQKDAEDLAKSCQKTADPQGCFGKSYYGDRVQPLPNNLNNILTDYDPNTDLHNLLHNDGRLGLSASSGYANSYSVQGSFSYYYDKVMNNDNISSQTKGIAEQIKNILGNTSDNIAMTAYSFGAWSGTYDYPLKDPITGEVIGNVNTSTITDVYKPKTSTGTDVNSVLMCALGWNSDTGTNCY